MGANGNGLAMLLDIKNVVTKNSFETIAIGHPPDEMEQQHKEERRQKDLTSSRLPKLKKDGKTL